MIIYKATNNINGKVYIGQTIRTLEERISEHKRKKESVLGRAIRKYGKDNFSFEIIDSAENVDELNEKEKYWIDYYNSCDKEKGYNLCAGGDGTFGYHHSEESKKKMSEKKKEIYIGDGNPFYGKHHSEEAKKKMSEYHKNRVMTEEWKSNIGKSQWKKVINNTTGEIFNSIKEASEKTGIKATHISKVCKGKGKTTGGYSWSYYNA